MTFLKFVFPFLANRFMDVGDLGDLGEALQRVLWASGNRCSARCGPAGVAPRAIPAAVHLAQGIHVALEAKASDRHRRNVTVKDAILKACLNFLVSHHVTSLRMRLVSEVFPGLRLRLVLKLLENGHGDHSAGANAARVRAGGGLRDEPGPAGVAERLQHARRPHRVLEDGGRQGARLPDAHQLRARRQRNPDLADRAANAKPGIESVVQFRPDLRPRADAGAAGRRVAHR
jgi:hypothetical protein